MAIANTRQRFFQLCSASDSEGPLYSMVLANAKHRFLRLRRLSAWLSNVPESMNLDKLHRWSILLAGVGHRHRYKRPTAGVVKRTLLLLSHITYECYLYYIWISVVVRDTVSGATGPVFYQKEARYQKVASYQEEASNPTQLRMHKCPATQIHISMYMQ